MRSFTKTRLATALGLALGLAVWAAATVSASPAAPVVTFAVIGDSGTGKPEQYAVARAMEKTRATQPFSFVLMLGDNLYGKFDPKRSFVERFEKPYDAL